MKSRDGFEFRHHSTRQRVVLVALKTVTLLLTGFAIYNLGWGNSDLAGQLNHVGSTFVGFWIYGNLLRVKVEVQELFVPPIDIGHGKELMFIGLTAYIAAYFF